MRVAKKTGTDYKQLPYESATYGQKWWCFMNTPKVKLLYKTFNEFGVLLVFICYSLLGQTYKAKKFDYLFFGAVVFTLLNNLRHTFFFLTDEHTVVKDDAAGAKVRKAAPWSFLSWRRSRGTAIVNLLQYLALIGNVVTRQVFIQSTPPYAIVPTLDYEHNFTGDSQYIFAEQHQVQLWDTSDNSTQIWRNGLASDGEPMERSFSYAKQLYGRFGFDATVQRAPRLFSISSHMLYFIFHPEDVSANFKTPLTRYEWDASGCRGNWSDEFGFDECCWGADRLEDLSSDSRTNNHVLEWIKSAADSQSPVCYYPRLANLGWGNTILTNMTMLVATVLFLKNLRLTPLGAMVNSIVACLAAFVQWCIVALVVLVPFAVLQFNLFFPNSLLKSVDSGLDCTGL